MHVVVLLDDTDWHGSGCTCGLCNANGKSYGVAIYNALQTPEASDGDDFHERLREQEPLARVYGPSEDAAYHNARLEAAQAGWMEVSQ